MVSKKTTISIASFLGILFSYGIIKWFDFANSSNLFKYLIVGTLFFIATAGILYFLLDKIIFKNLLNLSKRNLIISLICSFLLSCFLMVSLTLYQILRIINSPLKWLVLLAMLFTVWILVLSVIFALLEKNIVLESKDIKKISRYRILIYALPCIIIWAIYFLSFYPGIMTSDSFSQWDQILIGKFNDWHPVFHTWIMWLVTRLWLSPAAISIFQIIVLSLVVEYTLYSLEKMRIPRIILYICMAGFALNPVNGMMNITLWKDILYSTSLLFFTVVVMNVVLSNTKWLDSKLNFLIFVISGLSALMFRHNGKFCFWPTILLLLIIFRKHFKKLIWPVVTILLLFLVIQFPLHYYLKVEPAFEGESYSVPLNIIGGIVKNGGYLTEYQSEYIDKIMPLDEWKKYYDPFLSNPTKFIITNYHSRFFEDKVGFAKLFTGLTWQNPKLALRAYSKITSIAWRIPEDNLGYTFVATTEMDSNPVVNKYNLSNTSLIGNSVHKFLIKIFNFTNRRDVKWLFWRPALPLVLIFLAAIVSFIKNGFRIIPIFSLIILNHMAIMIAIPAQDFRYLYANSLVFLPLLVFSLIQIQTEKNLNL